MCNNGNEETIRFGSESDDHSQIYVDDKLIVDNKTPRLLKSGTVNIPPANVTVSSHLL